MKKLMKESFRDYRIYASNNVNNLLMFKIVKMKMIYVEKELIKD